MKVNVSNEEIQMSQPKYMPNSSLVNPNKNFDAVGHTDTLNDTSTSMLRVIEHYSGERGIVAHPNAPCKGTLSLYQEKSTLRDPTISLIK